MSRNPETGPQENEPDFASDAKTKTIEQLEKRRDEINICLDKEKEIAAKIRRGEEEEDGVGSALLNAMNRQAEREKEIIEAELENRKEQSEK